MANVEENLKVLEEVSTKLSEATDELSRELERVESRLNQLNVGVTAWLPNLLCTTSMGHTDGCVQKEAYRFGYAKGNRGWGFYVKKVLITYSSLEDTAPYTTDELRHHLADAPRKVRVEALPLLGDLIEALAEKAKTFLEGIKAARKQVPPL